ncbi:MAG: arginine repressor [Caldithrix sp.]|nr:arginine repressor [Caldithrix sp.]
MTNKHMRQAKIKEIINTTDISSQEDLLQYLIKEGFETTQATLSRDLHEIGIIRIPHGDGFKYVFHQTDNPEALKNIIGMEIINVTHNESTVVVKTMPGRAQGVGIYLDKIRENHILGTVAGDDTIIIIPDSHDNIDILVEKIKSVMI